MIVSLPSWERGLKYLIYNPLDRLIHVAPLVGARIEISSLLKAIRRLCVAPLVGARIEIRQDREDGRGICVAPLVGARIEILCDYFNKKSLAGRSPRGSAD